MFVLRSLGKFVRGESGNECDLMQLPSGQFYRLKVAGSAESGRKCIFNDGALTIRKTSTEFQYQLVVSRIFDEGEAELEAEAGEDVEDEHCFLVDEALKFRTSSHEESPAFRWFDLSGNTTFCYEFVADGSATKPTLESFELTIYQCMFERKWRKPHSEATISELQSFIQGGESTDVSATGAERVPLPPVAELPPVLECVGSVSAAQLYAFEPEEGAFLLRSQEVSACLSRVGDFQYWLSVSDSHQGFLRQKVSSLMNATFNLEHLSFIWCYYDTAGHTSTWSLKFADASALKSFQTSFGRCLYETLNEAKFLKANKEEQGYVLSALQEDAEMRDACDDAEAASDVSEGETSENSDGEGASVEEVNTKPADSAANSQLAVGYKQDRSFVVRGSKIGVFRHTTDRNLEFATTINSVSNAQNRAIEPSKVLLHEEDSAMVLMDPTTPHALYKMDLEYGKVVEEWQVHDYVRARNIAPQSKYAQMTGEKTLVGMSSNSLFLLDPRLASQNKLVESQWKQYLTKNDFSCAATTQDGKLAVGSNKGDVRLFNRLGTNAKTALPALGDPITGIDVSNNGRWLVATCKTYLLLIDTKLPDARDLTGFDKSFPKDKKPLPKRLQLKPEHVAYMNKPVCFTAARFNAGPDSEEKSIITSTGPYIITWNFRRVKQGKVYDYQIKKYADNVVADDFKFGQDREIVVTLPHDVTMASKKSLEKPEKVLQTPTKKLKSRSSIVNSPY